jgi:hypothetical protein
MLTANKLVVLKYEKKETRCSPLTLRFSMKIVGGSSEDGSGVLRGG